MEEARAFANLPTNVSKRMSAAVKDPTLLKSFGPNFRQCSAISQQIALFGRSVKETISNPIYVIRLGSPIRHIERKLRPHLLYVCRVVHGALLQEVRKELHTAIVGNAGIGKGVFQQYFLSRIFNEESYGPLPADYFGNTNPFEVVVGQVGVNFRGLYILPKRKHEVLQSEPELLLKALEPQQTVYLFEPGEDICEPEWSQKMPTLAYVLSNSAGYKEFLKRGDQTLYYPNWDLDELLSIADVMWLEPSFLKKMKHLYEDSAVEERFNEFGGIFRYCLPQSPHVVRIASKVREIAVEEAVARNFILFGSIQHPDVSHHLVLFTVKTKNESFESATIGFVNENVRDEPRNVWLSVLLLDKICALMRNDEMAYMEKQQHFHISTPHPPAEILLQWHAQQAIFHVRERWNLAMNSF